VDRESVNEGEGLALGQVRLDLLVEDRLLLHVRHRDHDDIRPLDRFRDLNDFKPEFLGDRD
jgi:hypothetical protein